MVNYLYRLLFSKLNCYLCRVVAVDQRGYGESDKPSGKENYTAEKIAGDINQLVPALG